MKPYATIKPEKVSGSAITNESAVRRCGVKRDRYSATATPTSVDSVAATSVNAALPPSAVQNPEVPKTRTNAAPPSRNASTATASTGSAKNNASRATPGEARANWVRLRMANFRHSRDKSLAEAVTHPSFPRKRESSVVGTNATGSPLSRGRRTWFVQVFICDAGVWLLTARRCRPPLVDVGLFRGGGLHVERTHLRRRGQLVGDVVGQLHSRHRRAHETLRENAL